MSKVIEKVIEKKETGDIFQVSKNVNDLVDILYSHEMKKLEKECGDKSTFIRIVKLTLEIILMAEDRHISFAKERVKVVITQFLRTASFRALLLKSDHTRRDIIEAISHSMRMDKNAIANEPAIMASSLVESDQTNPTQTADKTTNMNTSTE